MAKNMYSYIRDSWKSPDRSYVGNLQWERTIDWRAANSFVRVDRPTRLDRARALGYRAKQGFLVVRARIRRGGQQKRTIKGGRRAKRKGIQKMTVAKSIQRIAEERTARHYPNTEVLNSYYVGEDGKHKYYEVILVDTSHPAIVSDPKINWICEPQHSRRAFRGLTSAGIKGRGLRWKGKGAERFRPSRAANIRRERRTQKTATP
jgi:large subunit ribosomal protein L15e